MALDVQNADLSSRPAAGRYGAYYWAEDMECLYRDDGTMWHQLTPSAWQTWTPTIGPIDGSGSNASAFFSLHVTSQTARYRTLPQGEIDIMFSASVAVDGTNPGWGGINIISLPAPGNSFENPLNAQFQADVNRCWVQGTYMTIYSAFSRQWDYGNHASTLSISGKYSTD